MYVQPRAAQDRVGGLHAGALRVRVRAAPREGEANEAVCRALARALGVPPSAAQLHAGERSRRKRVRILGDAARLLERLAFLQRSEIAV